MPDNPSHRAGRATVIVLGAALTGVTAVWLLSAWWSFAEQTRAADTEGFAHPAVLPWMLDGLAFALALTALAAALDARPAVAARVGALLALAASAYVNVRGVYVRTGDAPSTDALTLAGIAPVSAYLAFEVILGAVRRQVLRWRGEPAPAAIPLPRPVRLLLSPLAEPAAWRRHVLAVTAPTGQVADEWTSAPAALPDVTSGAVQLDYITRPALDQSPEPAAVELPELPAEPEPVAEVVTLVPRYLAELPEDASKRTAILAALDATAGDVPAACGQLATAGVTVAREYAYRIKRNHWTAPAEDAAAVNE